jgi:class 3 adenylate cyclase/tetratricopeptide (TPR) repeat protein
MSYNNIAVIYKDQGRYDLSLEYLLKSLELEEALNDKRGIAYTVNLIGSVHWNLGNYNEALDFYQRSLKLRKELGDKEGVAASMVSIGNTCKKMGMYSISLQYFQNALENFEDLKQENNIAFCLNEIATAYSNLQVYDKAVDYYLRTLKLREKRGDRVLIANTLKNLGITYKKMEKYNLALDYYNKALSVFNEINNKNGQLTIESYKGNIYRETKNDLKALSHYLKSFEISSEISDFTNMLYTTKQIAEIYYNLKNFKQASDYLIKNIELKDSIANKSIAVEVEKKIAKYTVDKKEEEIAYINKINQLEFSRQESLIKRKNWITNLLFGGLLVILFFLIVLFMQKKKVNLTNTELKHEKDKSDRLLLNVLPYKVANDLKLYGYSEPELFENVTIFFSDLVNFTETSTELKPKHLIGELNALFTRFDEIMEKHGCERIKTIGDAYLAVCGMPDPEPENAERIINAGLEIIDFIKERNKTNFVDWDIRIGVHTGRVVGGIVGTRKYIYDVFGDAVNTASRMETNSEGMRINISETTYNHVKNKFSFIERPAIEVKGKGEMRMFFVDA